FKIPPCRTLERLVIEPGRQNCACRLRQQRQDIEVRSRPPPHGGCLQAFAEPDLASTNRWPEAIGITNCQRRIAVLNAGSIESARTSILQAACDDADAVGD